MFLSSEMSLSHQRELCPWPRLGLWWSPDVMSSEWNVTLRATSIWASPGPGP